ncbi:MAG TPA: amino acid permease [Caulobacteraceae bacterium]|nr:amino acid permease [Caulobacteraceae bacterium]
MNFLTRRKSIDAMTAEAGGERQLRRTLGWPHLMALGVGAIVGTGIYTLIGQGADRAGPAVILSFAIAGVVCACAALAYAEMSTLMPASGSAYTYTYAVLGEGLAWIVGWSLILEYTVVCSTVAVGWSGYATGFLNSLGAHLPAALTIGPGGGGLVNLPAVMITFVVAALLAIGTRESATVNTVLVALKIAALAVFVAIALPHFDAANFKPFMPYGFTSHQVAGVQRGVMGAAALIFFAFYGFDAVSTAAEEARNPSRDLIIGIVGSMAVCTVLYMLIAAAALGAMPFGLFAKSNEPLALILRSVHAPGAARIIAAAAVVALPTVILAFMFGQSRIFFVMARDGLLPRALSAVNARTHTPVAMTIFTAIVVAIVAGVFQLGQIAEVANSGTLAAFVAVSTCMLVLRRTDPDRPRVFRTPLAWALGPIAILGCIYLFFSLAHLTQVAFLIWNAIGVVVYLLYGRRRSQLALN